LTVDYTRLQWQLPKIIIIGMIHLPFDLLPYQINGGLVDPTNATTLRLGLPSNCKEYCDAQVDDYHHLPRSQFRWSPPCHFEVRARASSNTPPGTLGFGFWNDPFTFSMGQGGAARRFPAMPQALWFFYGSNDNDIRLDPDLPGYGWKASSLRSPQIPLPLLAPLGALALPISYIPILRTIMMKVARGILSVDEKVIPQNMDQWHSYTIEWGHSEAIFKIDGEIFHHTDSPPKGPLGFVAWVDNQFAIASENKPFRFGVLQTEASHWLEMELITLGL
jgi:hypothetical protein